MSETSGVCTETTWSGEDRLHGPVIDWEEFGDSGGRDGELCNGDNATLMDDIGTTLV